MISKIDRYIIKKFFITFLFCMLLFTVIAIAVDSSEHTDDFVKSKLSTIEIIRQYYLGFIPWIWGLMYPLFVFIAVIFFTSKMALRSEVIAIIASGTTYNRWLRPYFISGFIFAAVLWYANSYVIPKGTGVKNAFVTKYIDLPSGGSNQGRCLNCFYKRIDSVTYIGIRYFDTSSKSAGSFFLEKIREGKVFYNLRAQRMEWDSAAKNWKLSYVTERTINGMKETLTELPAMNIDLKINPRDLANDKYLKDRLTTPQLADFIKKETQRGREGLEAFQVEQYRRTATPVTVWLLSIIGAIIASRKTRGGSGVHLAMGIIIAALFILSDRFSTVFSVQGNLSPYISAWMPNIVFALVGLFLYLRAPK